MWPNDDGIIAKHTRLWYAFLLPKAMYTKIYSMHLDIEPLFYFDLKTRKYHSDDEACPFDLCMAKNKTVGKRSHFCKSSYIVISWTVRHHFTSYKFLNGLSLLFKLVIFITFYGEKNKKGDKSHCDCEKVLCFFGVELAKVQIQHSSYLMGMSDQQTNEPLTRMQAKRRVWFFQCSFFPLLLPSC